MYYDVNGKDNGRSAPVGCYYMPTVAKDNRINNVAIIQYELENGDMKILAFSDYDMSNLKHRVSMHLPKKILSIQFYYNVSTNKDVHLIKKGVILE